MNAQHLRVLRDLRFLSATLSDQQREALDAAIAALAAPKEAGDVLPAIELLIAARNMAQQGFAHSPVASRINDALDILHKLAAPSKEAGPRESQFAALWTQISPYIQPADQEFVQVCLSLALANPPGDQRQEGETFWERHHADMAREAGLSMTRTAPGQYSFARGAQAASPPPEAEDGAK